MTSRKRPDPQAPLGDPAEAGPDDGADPKKFHDRRRPRHAGCTGIGHSDSRLCRQVRDVLVGLFPGLADEVLRDLSVVSVNPAPHGGRLMVTVAVPRPADATDRTAAEARLSRAAGLVRREVAAGVHRRKAPEVAFRVV